MRSDLINLLDAVNQKLDTLTKLFVILLQPRSFLDTFIMPDQLGLFSGIRRCPIVPAGLEKKTGYCGRAVTATDKSHRLRKDCPD